MAGSRQCEDQRGQTEPLAALVAVAAVCLALSTYAVYVADVLPAGTDRAVEEATSARVWTAIGTDGVYDPDTDLEAAIDETDLPAGYAVSVTVTTADENGTASVVAEALFVPDGTDDGPRPTDPPANRRPVAVEYAPGDVRGGTLVVEVWK